MFSVFTRSVTIASLALISAYASAGPSQVPFKATVTVVDTVSPEFGAADSLCPFQLFGTSMGSGTASHLGKITFVANDCATPSQGSGLPTFQFNGLPRALTITAANGDKLVGTYSGMLVPVGGFDPKTGLVPYTVQGGQFSLESGTGRFKNVVLHGGVLAGTENLNLGNNPKNLTPSTGTFELNGQISY